MKVISPRYRLAVLADIHGNLPALEAVLADLSEHGPVDAFLIAGDIICGPRQAEALRQVSDMGAIMIQGNNESVITQLANGSAPEYMYTAQQFNLYRWAWQHLAPGQLDLLSSLPEQRVIELPGATAIRMVHGSPRRIDEPVRPPIVGELLPLFTESVLICGHIHQPWQVRQDGRLVFNPGAVTGSQLGRVEANYVLLEWDGQQWEAHLQAVEYNLNRLRLDYLESGLLDSSPLARAILINTCSGSNQVAFAFYGYAWRLAEESGYGQLPYIPDTIWKQADETFPWNNWE